MLNITVNKIPEFNQGIKLEAAKKPSGDNEEVLIPYKEADNKLILLVNNEGGAEATITVEPGDMPMSGAEEDILSVPADSSVAIAFESGRYKKKDGYLHIIASNSTLGFQLIAMP